MSAEGAAALFERVSSDEQFRAQLEAAETPEEKRRIVTDAGYDVTREDLPTMRKAAGLTAEISDENLEKVSGGQINTWDPIGPIDPKLVAALAV